MKHPEFKPLLEACVMLLAVDRPVNVRWRRGGTFHDTHNGEVCGLCYTKPGYHTLVIAKGAADWQEILAHELTHAHVFEFHPRAAWHGRTFQRRAAALRRDLRGLGFVLGPIFRKGVDE